MFRKKSTLTPLDLELEENITDLINTIDSAADEGKKTGKNKEKMEGEYSILEDEKSSILESNEEIQNEIESLKKKIHKLEEESSDLKIKRLICRLLLIGILLRKWVKRKRLIKSILDLH